VWLLAALPTVWGSPTEMENVGLLACSIGRDGGCWGCRVGYWFVRFAEVELPSSLARSWERTEEAPALAEVPGRVGPAREREASSLTGGAGAEGSSGASAPNGPSGPMESSSDSRVVDCARLPCRRGVRDLEGASFTPLLERGEGVSNEVLAGVC